MDPIICNIVSNLYKKDVKTVVNSYDVINCYYELINNKIYLYYKKYYNEIYNKKYCNYKTYLYLLLFDNVITFEIDDGCHISYLHDLIFYKKYYRNINNNKTKYYYYKRHNINIFLYNITKYKYNYNVYNFYNLLHIEKLNQYMYYEINKVYIKCYFLYIFY